MGMGRGVSVLVALGLSVHLIETVLLLRDGTYGYVEGLPACLPLDQLVYLQDDFLSHSVNISYKAENDSKDCEE